MNSLILAILWMHWMHGKLTFQVLENCQSSSCRYTGRVGARCSTGYLAHLTPITHQAQFRTLAPNSLIARLFHLSCGNSPACLNYQCCFPSNFQCSLYFCWHVSLCSKSCLVLLPTPSESSDSLPLSTTPLICRSTLGSFDFHLPLQTPCTSSQSPFLPFGSTHLFHAILRPP